MTITLSAMPLSLEILERALSQNLHKSALDWK